MRIISFLFVLAMGLTLVFTGCDSLDEIAECAEQFSDYSDRLEAYEDIEGTICDNQQAAQDFIDFLETEAKGSCIEDQLEENGENLDDIIAEAKAKLEACPS